MTHPMIEHKGKQVHTTNSNGQPIHHTEAGIKAFHDWFGDSKSVDEHGRPMVHYTGTSMDKDFTKFKVPKNGAWFTTDPKVASDYAKDNDSQGLKYDPDKRNYVDINKASRVLPVYLKTNKTHVMGVEDKAKVNVPNYKKAQGVFHDQLRASGHDSVEYAPGVVAVIGGDHQIKSALGNSGKFDPKKGLVEGIMSFSEFILETTMDDSIEFREKLSSEKEKEKPTTTGSAAALTALKHAHAAKLRGDDERHSYWLKRAYKRLTEE